VVAEFVNTELQKLAPEKSLRAILEVQWKSIQSGSLKW
jgi:hypothetical protein